MDLYLRNSKINPLKSKTTGLFYFDQLHPRGGGRWRDGGWRAAKKVGQTVSSCPLWVFSSFMLSNICTLQLPRVMSHLWHYHHVISSRLETCDQSRLSRIFLYVPLDCLGHGDSKNANEIQFQYMKLLKIVFKVS